MGRSETVRWRLWVGLAVVVVLGVGALEGCYGSTDTGDLFGSDAVQYLDCARAIGRGDWRSALNPLWSQGYPALLALARPMFSAGMRGDWVVTRVVNVAIFCLSLGCFAYLLAGIRTRRRDGVFWLCGAGVFVSAEVCLGQVSRVGPDELVAAFFFLACGLLVRLVGEPRVGRAVGLGIVLGLGFLAKAVFLPLGCVMLAALVMGLWGRRVWVILPAAMVFAGMVLGYGTMLSRAVGYRTLGESGSLNYAWHVDRLAKWVHWEGGVESAEDAWPKPWIARFVQWDRRPPEFGMPLHPSLVVGSAPKLYVFHEAVTATYIPYYDPAYWYLGYKHVVRWRYQVVALGKSLGDLAKALLTMPLVYAVLAAVWILGFKQRGLWLLVACAGLGVAIYLPVHLEGRYLSGFLAVLAVVGLAGVQEASARQRRVVLALVLVGTAVQVVKEQRVVWSRVAHGWSYRDNVEWKVAQAVAGSGLARGSEIGMVSWTGNLHCDWAYLAGLHITSEIANGEDEKTFWALGGTQRGEVMAHFREGGAQAVLSWDSPPGGRAEGWATVGGSPMWMYRF